MKSIKKISKITTIFKITLIIFIILTFSFNSCFLSSMNPLGYREESKIDNNLLGIWKYIKHGNDKIFDVSYLLILKSENNSLILIGFDSDEYNYDDNAFYQFQGYITKINNNNFINLQLLDIKDGSLNNEYKNFYIFAHYKFINNNNLLITQFDQYKFEDFIKEKQIKGNIDEGKFLSSISLTDTTDNINNLIKNQTLEDILQESGWLLKRVKLK